MDPANLIKVKNAILACSLTSTSKNWEIIDIPSGIYKCVHLVIPTDIKGYRLHIVFANRCSSTAISKVKKHLGSLTIVINKGYSRITLQSKNETHFPSQIQIENDLKAAIIICRSLGLI